MKTLSRDEQAKRLYRRTYFGALFALSLFGNLAVMGVLWLAESLMGQELMYGGRSSGIAGGFTIVWMLAAAFIAAWRVRRAGLSREAHVTEFFHQAGARAASALQLREPFEVRLVPVKSKRLGFYLLYAVCMVGLSSISWSLLRGPTDPLLSKFTSVLGLIFFFTIMAALCLYRLAFDWPDFHIDAHGIRASHCLWFRSIRWEPVDTLEFLTVHNILGELALIQPRFKNTRGKVLLWMNLAPLYGCSTAARDSIVAFLRAACSEQEATSSTYGVMNHDPSA